MNITPKQLRQVKQEEKEEESDEVVTNNKTKQIVKPRIMPVQEKRELMRDLQRRVRRQALKEVLKKREKSGQLRGVRVEFEPAEVLDTGVFVHRTPEFVQLSIKPLFNGKEKIAINTYPCPPETCVFEVLLEAKAKLGLVSSNDIKMVALKQSVTLSTKTGKLWIGRQSMRIKCQLTGGSRVRMMVCVATRKFRIYVNDKKEVTCDLPLMLAEAKNIYFYVELLGQGCVKILK